MQNIMPERVFLGHEIFLVDLNKVFFSVFPFLNGKCINRKRNK